MKQSLAISLGAKRKKKIAKGGDIESDKDDAKGLAFGGDVQDDVNEVFETEDAHSEADSEHFSLGGKVEMLVDKMLKMKMGDAEAEHFSDGGYLDKSPSVRKQEMSDYFNGPKVAPQGPSMGGPKHLSDEELDALNKKNAADSKELSERNKKAPVDTGEANYASGGKIEQMVNACIDKKMMAAGGIIPEKARAHNDPMDQSATGPDDESNHMDDDILSEDAYMNENMDHEDSMEPNKKKKLMSSILAEVRKHNMGK